MPRAKRKLRMTDVRYWTARGYNLTEARHRAKFTARGTVRKSAEERGKVHRRVWREAWADGSRVKAPKKKKLTSAQRHDSAVQGWKTRRKNQRKAERITTKPRRSVRSYGLSATVW